MEEDTARDRIVEELTLLLLYLTSWQEAVIRGFEPARRAWKGFRFEALDALEEAGYLMQSHRAKSVTLTEEGVRQAQALQAKYLGSDALT